MTIVLICIAAAIAAGLILTIAERKKSGRESRASEVRSNFSPLPNYNRYTMTGHEKLVYTGLAACVLLAVGYIFFMNFFICLVFCGFSFLYLPVKRKELIKRRKSKLNLQFEDALHSISSSLSAGRSVEGAFKAALGDLVILYPDEDVFIIKELELINRRVEMNETLESALLDFAGRADIEDITNFADVFITCKSTGGNLIEVIKNTASIINQKIEIKNEIEVIIAEQKLSQRILNIMPFGLLVLIMTSSPDYVRPLYSAKGHGVMFIVLALLVAAYFIGSKIADIKV